MPLFLKWVKIVTQVPNKNNNITLKITLKRKYDAQKINPSFEHLNSKSQKACKSHKYVNTTFVNLIYILNYSFEF